MKQEKDDRLNLRMEGAVMGWLRKAAAKKRVKVSALVREFIQREYEERHDK